LRPVPLQIPPLSNRARDLPRIVEEYARDAINELSANDTAFTRAARDWVIAHSASTLPEIAKGTRRLVALGQGGSINRAAMRLGMSHVALSQWLWRRGYGRRGHGGGQS
jgi:DNA-binding NtrC family response regulator